MQFVRITDPDKRAYLVATVQQVSDGFALEQGDNVLLGSTALNTLCYLPADADGHYDGQHLWLEGAEYDVAEVDPQPGPEPEPEPIEIRWHMPLDEAGQRESQPNWPSDWPLPDVGEQITYDDRTYTVTKLAWYPVGIAGYGHDGKPVAPFVKIALC